MAQNLYSDVYLGGNKIGRDADNLLDFTTDNEITFRVGAGDGVVFKASGEIEATKFDGALEGQADTVATIAGLAPNTATTQATQPNITSLGTLTALDVDDINLNAKTLTITGDTSDTFTIVAGAAGATTLTTTDAAAAAGHFEVAADGNITLDAAGNIYLEAAGNTMDLDADYFSFTSSTSGYPNLNLRSTIASAVGATLQFTKDRYTSAGADGDDIGTILFNAGDAAQTQTNFANIIGEISEADDTDEAGKLTLNVAASDGTTTALNPGLILEGEHATGSEVDVTIANGAASTTTIAGDLTVTTEATIPSRKFAVSSTTDGNVGSGDIVYFGSGEVTIGKIYHYKSDGSWEAADANDVAKCDGLLGVATATGTASTVGMLLRGMITIVDIQGTEAVGDVLYLSESATGEADCVAPAGSADVVRIIGYCLSTDDQIWFNPSADFIVLA
jgi:hypothetical protein